MCNEKDRKKESCFEHDNQEHEHMQDTDNHESTINDCCKQLHEIQDKYTLVLADLHNFRQRIDKERIQWSTIAQTEIVKKLLPIVDNFDRALQEAAKVEGEENQTVVGFSMINKSLLKMLSSIGVETMTDFTHFDPEKHEAIMQVNNPDYASGEIVSVLEKGYLFKHEVIRPAKVSVAE